MHGGLTVTNDEELKDKLEKMPNIETLTKLSSDRKWIIEKTIITSIKPVTYYKKMLEQDVNDMFSSANRIKCGNALQTAKNQ